MKSEEEKLYRRSCELQGLIDEGLAKSRLYRKMNREKPHLRPEIEIKVQQITNDFDKYKRQLDKIRKDFERINGTSIL